MKWFYFSEDRFHFVIDQENGLSRSDATLLALSIIASLPLSVEHEITEKRKDRKEQIAKSKRDSTFNAAMNKCKSLDEAVRTANAHGLKVREHNGVIVPL